MELWYHGVTPELLLKLRIPQKMHELGEIPRTKKDLTETIIEALSEKVTPNGEVGPFHKFDPFNPWHKMVQNLAKSEFAENHALLRKFITPEDIEQTDFEIRFEMAKHFQEIKIK